MLKKKKKEPQIELWDELRSRKSVWKCVLCKRQGSGAGWAGSCEEPGMRGLRGPQPACLLPRSSPPALGWSPERTEPTSALL